MRNDDLIINRKLVVSNFLHAEQLFYLIHSD